MDDAAASFETTLHPRLGDALADFAEAGRIRFLLREAQVTSPMMIRAMRVHDEEAFATKAMKCWKDA